MTDEPKYRSAWERHKAKACTDACRYCGDFEFQRGVIERSVGEPSANEVLGIEVVTKVEGESGK